MKLFWTTIIPKLLIAYSKVSNKRAACSINFSKKFQPAWPYYILHVLLILENFTACMFFTSCTKNIFFKFCPFFYQSFCLSSDNHKKLRLLDKEKLTILPIYCPAPCITRKSLFGICKPACLLPPACFINFGKFSSLHVYYILHDY